MSEKRQDNRNRILREGEYQYDPREYICLINKKALSIQRHNRYIIEIAYCVNLAFFL